MKAALLVRPGEIVVDEIPDPSLDPMTSRSPSVGLVCAVRI